MHAVPSSALDIQFSSYFRVCLTVCLIALSQYVRALLHLVSALAARTAFDGLKLALSSAPVLALLDFDARYEE